MATSSKTCITRYGIITDIDTGDKETGFSVNVDAEVIS